MFGWLKDKEDERDLTFSVSFSTTPLPPEVNLVKSFPLVYNQLNTNSCVAHSVSMAYMIQLISQKSTFFSPSRLFTYFNARYLDNPRLIQDQGTYLRSGIKALSTWGTCDEAIWKFDTSKVNVKPQKSKYDPYQAAKEKVVQTYARVPKSAEIIKQVIAEGNAVVFGLYLYSKFQQQLTDNGYVFQFPKPGDNMVGGHALTLVGYSDEKKAFKCRNSWGKGWGLNGDFWIPYAIMESQYVDDLWRIQFIKP